MGMEGGKTRGKSQVRGFIEETVLRGIESIEAGIEEYFYIFLDARGGYVHVQRERWKRYEQRLKQKQLRAEQKYFSSFLCKLRSEGLITKDGIEWKITKKVLKKMEALRFFRKKQEIIRNSAILPPGKHLLVIFDIPEVHRKKRALLRWVLCDLGYELIQKSVWMGNRKISKEFLEAAQELDIAKYIEIFEVSKLGTLRK